MRREELSQFGMTNCAGPWQISMRRQHLVAHPRDVEGSEQFAVEDYLFGVGAVLSQVFGDVHPTDAPVRSAYDKHHGVFVGLASIGRGAGF